MSHTIWKQTLEPLGGVQTIMLPAGAEMLFARAQRGEVCVWYRCDPEAPKEPRELVAVMTGAPAPSPEDGRHLGSALLHGGSLVVHVFERIKP